MSIFLVCVLAVLLAIFLIDDPSFDLFEDKNYTVVDEDYLERRRARIKAAKHKHNDEE